MPTVYRVSYKRLPVLPPQLESAVRPASGMSDLSCSIMLPILKHQLAKPQSPLSSRGSVIPK